MAKLVGVFAASHTPVMLNFPDAIPDGDRKLIFKAFSEMGEQLNKLKPDVIIAVCDDHVHNFFLNNLPAFCIGTASSYPTPVEHWLKAEKQVLLGDAEFGAYLLSEALENGFDPAFSMDLTLDHGILTPLLLANVTQSARIVPLLVNCVQPPMPSMRRALEWGCFLRKSIDSYPKNTRVVVLGTGGLSHDIATPRMGFVNENFDRDFLTLLTAGNRDPLIDFCTGHVNEAGNGAEEIRNWLVAHGAAGEAGFSTSFYQPVSKWYTGIGLGKWAL